MSGSGVRTGMIKIIMAGHLKTIPRDLKMVNTGCCAVARGTEAPGSCVVLFGAGMSRVVGRTTSGFGWCVSRVNNFLNSEFLNSGDHARIPNFYKDIWAKTRPGPPI